MPNEKPSSGYTPRTPVVTPTRSSRPIPPPPSQARVITQAPTQRVSVKTPYKPQTQRRAERLSEQTAHIRPPEDYVMTPPVRRSHQETGMDNAIQLMPRQQRQWTREDYEEQTQQLPLDEDDENGQEQDEKQEDNDPEDIYGAHASYGNDEEYEEPQRMRTSTRRYDRSSPPSLSPQGVTPAGNIRRASREFSPVNTRVPAVRGDVRIQRAGTAHTQVRSAQPARQQTHTRRPQPVEEPVLPLKRQAHSLVYLGIGMILMVVVFMLALWIHSEWVSVYNQWTYGWPRTYTTFVHDGHGGDVQETLTARNINGVITMEEQYTDAKTHKFVANFYPIMQIGSSDAASYPAQIIVNTQNGKVVSVTVTCENNNVILYSTPNGFTKS